MAETELIEVLCKTCGNYTDHAILHIQERHHDEDGFWGNTKWETIQCCGCKDVSLKSTFSSCDMDFGEKSVKLFPCRGNYILQLKTFRNCPSTLWFLYRQVIDAFDAQLAILCAAGLRSLIEGICADKGINKGPVVVKDKNGTPKTNEDGTPKIQMRKHLEGKIEGLAENGLLTVQHAKALHELRFLGNDALHELERPSEQDLMEAIGIVEHTLENVYELEEKARTLRTRREK